MGSRVLIRTPNHLGDCIMAMPMVSETREAFPGSSVSVLVPERLADLYEKHPSVDAIIKIPTPWVHGLIGVVKIRELISLYEFEVGFVLPPSFGSAAAFKLAGVRERIGYVTDGRRLLLTRPLSLPAPLNSQHRSVTYFDILRRTIDRELEYAPPMIFLNDEDHARAEKILDGIGIDNAGRFAAVAFQAVAESRRWGTAKYTELVRALVEKYDLSVVLVGATAEQKSGDEIVREVGDKRVANLAGKTSLREVAAVMSRATLFVGNDSGPAHLAAAAGTPVVVLSGADDPKETSPPARRKRLVYLAHLDCISCVKNKCPLKGEAFMQCMNGISVATVLVQIEELLREIG